MGIFFKMFLKFEQNFALRFNCMDIFKYMIKKCICIFNFFLTEDGSGENTKGENLKNGDTPGGGDNPDTEDPKDGKRMEEKPIDAGKEGAGFS